MSTRNMALLSTISTVTHMVWFDGCELLAWHLECVQYPATPLSASLYVACYQRLPGKTSNPSTKDVHCFYELGGPVCRCPYDKSPITWGVHQAPELKILAFQKLQAKSLAGA